MNKDKMNQRRGFIFYRSFLAAIDELPPEYRPILLDAIVRYALCGQAPDFSHRENAFIYRAIWANIQPVLQKDINHFIAGLNGGAPEGNSNASKQPKTTKNNQAPSMMNDEKIEDEKMEDEKMKDEKMKDGSIARSASSSFVVPTLDELHAFCVSENIVIDEAAFMKHYALSGWTDRNGKPVSNWRQAAHRWCRNEPKPHPGKGKTSRVEIPQGSDDNFKTTIL